MYLFAEKASNAPILVSSMRLFNSLEDALKELLASKANAGHYYCASDKGYIDSLLGWRYKIYYFKEPGAISKKVTEKEIHNTSFYQSLT
jgi:hypothetical protein